MLTLEENRGGFYCTDTLLGASAVDHFVPWSRWPNHAVENLVIDVTEANNLELLEVLVPL